MATTNNGTQDEREDYWLCIHCGAELDYNDQTCEDCADEFDMDDEDED